MARLEDMLAELAGWVDGLQAGDGEPVADAARIDRIAVLERLRSATAACQGAEMVAFARSQVEAQLAEEVHPRQVRRGIGDQVAEMIVTETRHLDAPTRRVVDGELHAAGITAMGERQAEACARRYASQADRLAYVQRGRTERKNRRVSLRPAPDTMSYLTGFLPVEHGVACLAALNQATDAAVAVGDPRSRDQIWSNASPAKRPPTTSTSRCTS